MPLVLSVGVGLACHDSDSSQQRAPRSAEAASVPVVAPSPRTAAVASQRSSGSDEPSDSANGHRAAPAEEASFDRVRAQPELPGDPEFAARRQLLLMRAKGEPAFFVRAPEVSADSSEDAAYQRHRLSTTRYPFDVLQQLLPAFRARPELGRQVLLRDGYLYTTIPELAYAIVSLVQPEHLFDQPSIWIQRGNRTMRASRSERGYVYDAGLFEGQPVKLLMFDRLGEGSEPTSVALHRDFRALAYELGFDRVRIRHLTERQILADLRYGGELWVPSLLKSDGARLELEVERPEVEGLELLRAEALERMRGIQALRHAMLLQIQEGLPFDEPRHEVGQEDGKLRRSFRFVYEQGRDSFKIRSDRYPVFDTEGRPLAPQVCIDFLLDTFERASGTWWARRGQVRGVQRGRLDFEDYLPRDVLRRAQEFIDFAKAHPELFEVVEIPPASRVPQGDKRAFFRYLAERPDLFEAGDMALIRGATPWDEVSEHYHSFFIYETDPISGVPIAIAGNANTPALWSWESEARRTPLRTLRTRIRPSRELLERVAGDEPLLAPSPPPLVHPSKPSA